MVRQLTWNSVGGQLMDAFQREMEELAGRLQTSERSEETASAFSPRTNVAETSKAYELTLELPGMQAEDFNIELDEGRLSISGERTQEVAEEGTTFHRIERQSGNFHRIFALGPDLAAENVTAEYKDGILKVVVPKTEKAQPKKIQVKS